MKRANFAVIILIFALAVPSFVVAAKKSPSSPDKTYTNSDYKFRLNYPGTWSYEESEKPNVDVSAGYGLNIKVGGMPGVPKMCNVKFAEDPKDKHDDDPNIRLVVISFKGPEKGKKKDKYRSDEEKKGNKGKSECVIVEQKGVAWGGQKATLVTTRCPETKKVSVGGKKKKSTVWRYMTSVNMKRVQDTYNIVGEMLCTTSGEKLCDEMADKGKAAEFDTKLKPARDRMIATTKFIK